MLLVLLAQEGEMRERLRSSKKYFDRVIDFAFEIRPKE
jgi:hypothetical protein